MPYDKGRSLGLRGSESGPVIRDDEHPDGTRITLESNLSRVSFLARAITCGIYGWMVHTRFFDKESDADVAYDAMRLELAQILPLIPYLDDPEFDARMEHVTTAIAAFVERFS